jgi:hypothetical protein
MLYIFKTQYYYFFEGLIESLEKDLAKVTNDLDECRSHCHPQTEETAIQTEEALPLSDETALDSFESILETKTSELPVAESVDSGIQRSLPSVDAESQSDSVSADDILSRLVEESLNDSDVPLIVNTVHMDVQTDFAFIEHKQGNKRI